MSFIFSANLLVLVALVGLVSITSAWPLEDLKESSNGWQKTLAEIGKNNLHHYICKKGDKRTGNVICHQTDNKFWTVPNDVKITLNCPANGTSGGIISYIQVDIWITSTNFRCDIIKGGIGERSVAMAIETLHTKSFRYVADVYAV